MSQVPISLHRLSIAMFLSLLCSCSSSSVVDTGESDVMSVADTTRIGTADVQKTADSEASEADTGALPPTEDVAECAPNCEEKQCGDDGCDGSCGTCSDGTECLDGACVGCQPTCTGAVCGDDDGGHVDLPRLVYLCRRGVRMRTIM